MKAAALKRRVQPQTAPAILAGQPSFRLPSIESTRTGYRMPEALPKSQLGPTRPYLATLNPAASPLIVQTVYLSCNSNIKSLSFEKPEFVPKSIQQKQKVIAILKKRKNMHYYGKPSPNRPFWLFQKPAPRSITVSSENAAPYSSFIVNTLV